MKKVKKQWVVVSIASFALLGASAYTMTNSSAVAHADTVSTASDNSKDQKATDNKSSDQNDQNKQSTSDSSNSGQAESNVPSIQTSNAGTISTYNNSDESAQYASQIKQGASDAFNNKANQSANISGVGASYYQASYDGAKQAMNSYNALTNGKGTGTQDYNYYGNTVTRQDGFTSDNKNAQTGTTGNGNKTATQGDNGNANGSTNGTTTATTSSSNSQNSSSQTDGTPLNYGSTDDTNQGGADTPKQATNSVSRYETTMDAKLNSSNNTSVKNVTAGQAINVPTSNTDAIVQEKSKFNGVAGLTAAYSQGVTYALTQQGLTDAETGKWQGVSTGSNGTTTDFYLSGTKNNASSDYDQAYRGARAAMNAFFNNNSFVGTNQVAQSSTSNAAYDAGFNDVVNQAAQGTVFVQNGQQWSSVIAGNTNTGTVGGNIAQDANGNSIKTIKLANDIDLSGATNGENDGTVNTNQASLTIDGQNHMMDYHGNNYTINRSTSGNLDLYVQNFQTIYGANYFGPYRAESGAAIHFSNLNYVGPQLLSSNSNDAYFSGNVNVVVPVNTSATYTSPFQSNVTIEGNGNQENLEVNNFILQPNAHYFGNTSPAKGGSNVVVQGNMTLGENSKMTLIARGGNGTAATNEDSSAFAVDLKNAGKAQLNINKNATLNVIPLQLGQGQTQGMFGGAVYANSATVNINGGTLNYEAYNGQSGYYNEPVDLKGSGTTVNITNGGILQVLMDSIPDTTTGVNALNGHQSSYYGLITNPDGGTVNVASRGNLNVQAINSDSTFNTPYYGPITINSVGANHVTFGKPSATPQFQTVSGTNTTTNNGQISASTVGIKYDNKLLYLYNFLLQSGSKNFTGTDLNGKQVNGTISGNKLEILDIPAVQFVGPISKSSTTNSDGSTTVTAYARISNFSQIEDLKQQQGLSSVPLYVGIASGATPTNGTVTYNSLTQVPGNNVPDNVSKADKSTYTEAITIPDDYNGGLIPISYDIPKGQDTTNVGIKLRYVINGVDSLLVPSSSNPKDGSSYTTNIESFNTDQNGNLVQGTSTNVVGGNTNTISQGQQDALTDMANGNSNAKNAQSFQTQTNSDYSAAYNNVQAGYQAYQANPNQDITKSDAYKNSDNPTALQQGFDQAAYLAGMNDAQQNKSNSTNPQYLAGQQAYQDAYNKAVKDIAAGKNPADVIAQAKKDAKNNPLTNNDAVLAQIDNWQGVGNFIKDEQAGTISTTSDAYKALTPGQQAAYNDAKTGYENALKVGPNQANPDNNANKSESSVFDYAQSIINGGNSATKPTQTTANMTNLDAAQNAYDLTQTAISDAREGKDSSKSVNDVTAYNNLKSGAEAALKNASTDGLNQMQLVGYDAVKQAGPRAYNAGVSQLTSGQKAADTSSQGSQDLKNQLTAGFKDAQTGYNAAMNGETAAPKNTDGSDNKGMDAGYNYGKSLIDGASAATRPTVATGNDDLATEQKAYDDAQKAKAQAKADLANNVQNPTADPKGNNANNADVYTAAYNAALKANSGDNAGKNAHDAGVADNDGVGKAVYNQMQDSAQGAKDFVDGKANQQPNNPAYTAAYNDAKKGFDAYLADPTKTSDSTDNPAYNKGVDAAKGVEASVKNAENNTNDNSDAGKGAADAIKAVKDAIANGQDASQLPDNNDDSKPLAYKQAYNAALQSAKDAAEQGKQSVVNPDSKNTVAPSQPALADVYKAAADNTQKGYDEGLTNGNVTNPNSDTEKAGYTKGQADRPAYLAGIKAYNDASDKNNVPAAPSSFDDGQKAVYNEAVKALQDAAKGTTDGTDVSPVYKAVNSQELGHQAGLAAAKAADAEGEDPTADLDQKAQDAAAKSSAPDKQAFITAYKNVMSGYNAAKNNDASAKSNGDDPIDQKAFDDGKAEYQAYAAAAKKNLEAGAEALLNDNKSNSADHANDVKKANPSTKDDKQFNQGVDDAKQALLDAQSNDPSKDAKYAGTNADTPAGDVYRGTKDAYNAVKNGTTPLTDDQLAKEDPVYAAAYKSALPVAQDAAAKGANDGRDNAADNSDSQANPLAKAVYQSARNDEETAFKNKLDGVADTTNTPAAQEGTQKGSQFAQALKDVANGKADASNNDASYKYGVTTAETAIANATNDGKAGKKLPADLNSIEVPAGVDPVAYREVYAGVLSGFTDGAAQKTSNSNSTKPYYNDAYAIGYKTGKDSAQKPTSAPQDFLNNKKATPKNAEEAKAYAEQYKEAKDGFEAGINGKNANSSSEYYLASYKAAKDGLAGIKLAKKGDTKASRNLLKSKSAEFAKGYEGYLKGIAAAKRTLKNDKKLSKKDLAGKDKVYVYAFKEAYKHEAAIQSAQGRKAGIRSANKHHSIPSNLYTRHSASYARAYVKAFKNEMKIHMPRYIYNTGTIYTHKGVFFNKRSRIAKFKYSRRYNSTVFRVVGIKYYKNRIPRYHLSNGAYVTTTSLVKNAYYRKQFKKFRVIKPTGTLIHRGKTFTKHNAVRRLHRGAIIHVKKVVKFYGITRLYIGKGEYVTSNKTFVKAIFR